MSDTYRVVVAPSARRQLQSGLPEPVVAAIAAFLYGPVTENPHRVGKRLREPHADLLAARRGTYRILYSVDDEALIVNVVRVEHRRDAYRT